MHIGGERVAATAGALLESLDPATGEVLAEVPAGGEGDVDAAVGAARAAQAEWAALAPAERARVLHRIASGIEAEAEALASLESRDTGKPLTQARSDVRVAARYFEFYAGVADKLMGVTIPIGRDFVDYTTREPLGVSGQIVPWNYPLQIGSRGIAPALAAANAVVVKPAEEAPLSLLELARIAGEAGLGPGALNVVTGHGDTAGAALARHPGIDQLTFTGSLAVGTLVMQAAAANVVPLTLELGGKCPNLVFADADVKAAIPVLVNALIQNAGQTCSAASRVIVERSIRDEVVARLAARLQTVQLGPGIDDRDMGPLISSSQLARVEGMVSGAREAGAEIVVGGTVASESARHGGFFYRPTLVDSVRPGSEIAREEVFGPVLVVLSFEDEDEAVALANATHYGLVCGVWTQTVGRAHRVARDVRAGQVYVNGYGAGGGAELPFGGVGKSGFGREKGIEGLSSYLQTKNVCVALA